MGIVASGHWPQERSMATEERMSRKSGVDCGYIQGLAYAWVLYE